MKLCKLLLIFFLAQIAVFNRQTHAMLDFLEAKEKRLDKKRKVEQEVELSLSEMHDKTTHPLASEILKAQPKSLFEIFKEILEKSPNPIPVITGITASDEDKEGSRKWVKQFKGIEVDQTHKWHTCMKPVLEALRKENTRYQYLPVDVNFAVASLCYVFEDETTEVRQIPYFFASGWPANNSRTSAGKFAKSISDKKAGSLLTDYSHYGLRFITMNYTGDQEEPLMHRSYDSLRDILGSTFKQELEHEAPILGTHRLETHHKVVSDTESGILAKLYFHSEQSIWMTAKKAIETFREAKRKRHVLQKHRIKYVILDICSIYDMCWCCGDSLASYCHGNQFGFPVYVRATGCFPYYDSPFAMKPRFSLRSQRTEFAGYETCIAYKMPLPSGVGSYEPFIAHSTANDFNDDK